ncbi:hypothetical protein CDL15_Pgr023151 [Punica granatum]|uniref:SKP1 component dimerisation domain-containing protein n=1 Tax=Punica granatum TaxID=22663 RepID=A0A218X4T5_PUNGR|nr:hypothetical protein CDL15_Pgr023151 [Punica granatum]
MPSCYFLQRSPIFVFKKQVVDPNSEKFKFRALSIDSSTRIEKVSELEITVREAVAVAEDPAENYLNIKGLLDLTCQTVADMIEGKTPEEIRKTFNIKNDFTPEEEEEVRRENQWAFE